MGDSTAHISVREPSGWVLGYVGDSLTEQGDGGVAAAQSLYPLGYDPTNLRADAVVGRSIWQNVDPWPTNGASQAVTTIRGLIAPSMWLIALCSNDFDTNQAGIQSRCESLIAKLKEQPFTRLLWVGPVVGPGSSVTTTQIATMYAALNAVDVAHPELDMRVLDISAEIHDGADETALWLSSDATRRHMTPAGYARRNSEIATFVAANSEPPSNPPLTGTATTHVTVRDVSSGASTVHVSVRNPPIQGTSTTHVTVRETGSVLVTADRTTVGADETVTLTGTNVASWAVDNGGALTGSGTTRTFVAPLRPRTVVYTVTVTAAGGATSSVQITVKAAPAAFRGGAWTAVRSHRTSSTGTAYGTGLYGAGNYGG